MINPLTVTEPRRVTGNEHVGLWSVGLDQLPSLQVLEGFLHCNLVGRVPCSVIQKSKVTLSLWIHFPFFQAQSLPCPVTSCFDLVSRSDLMLRASLCLLCD